jgi:hypothetical protein
MTIIQKLHASLVIRQVAHRQGISTSQCRASIQELINQTWATSDPEAKYRQIQLVGDSHIPSPEELILLISQKIS